MDTAWVDPIFTYDFPKGILGPQMREIQGGIQDVGLGNRDESTIICNNGFRNAARRFMKRCPEAPYAEQMHYLFTLGGCYFPKRDFNQGLGG